MAIFVYSALGDEVSKHCQLVVLKKSSIGYRFLLCCDHAVEQVEGLLLLCLVKYQ